VKAKLHVDHDGRHVRTRNDAEKKQSWCATSELSKWSHESQCNKTSIQIWHLSRCKLSLPFLWLREMCVW